METKSLELFIEVAQHGSFAGVARQHALDPSAVSRAIAGLEHALGVRLFERTTRTLALTEAGELYLQRVEPLIEELERAGHDALALRTSATGTLRLTASVAFGQQCIVPLLGAFRESYPDLVMELVLSDDNLDLVAERIDLAVRLAPAVDADLIGTRLMRTRYRVCAAPDYLAGHPAPPTPDDLAGHACLLYTLPDFRSRWLFRDRAGAVTEVPVSGDVAISNARALRDAAVHGLGPALLADWLADRDIARGRLVDLFPDFDVTATAFDTAAWLLYPSRTFLPVKVRVAIDFLRKHLHAPA